jgi:hypothetical protein
VVGSLPALESGRQAVHSASSYGKTEATIGGEDSSWLIVIRRGWIWEGARKKAGTPVEMQKNAQKEGEGRGPTA